jgi:hypothetical protein
MDGPDDLGLISIPGHLLIPDWLVVYNASRHAFPTVSLRIY